MRWWLIGGACVVIAIVVLAITGGGNRASQKRLADLKGHAVVGNKWAGWCGACRQEFPWLQQLSVKYGKQVAFLGVDSNDVSSDAKHFLSQLPVRYPWYEDSAVD